MLGFSKKTLLLVEDEAILALSQKMALENYGYSVLIAANGGQAIEKVHSCPEIDLVLMDINLGAGIDGTEAAEIILRDHDIPILFVSSHSEREIVEKTEKITSYGYVVKNSSITVLDASIKMAFKLFHSEKKAELVNNALVKTNSILNMTLEQSPIPMVLVGMPEQELRILNPAARKLFGFSDDESFYGTQLDEYNPPYTITDPDGNTLPIENLTLSRVIRGESVYNEEFMIIKNDGEHRNVLISGTPIFNNGEMIAGYIALIDITDRKAMEESLKISRDTAEIMLDLAADIIISEDFKGTILLLNKSGHTILGYEYPELIGKNLFDLCTPEEIKTEMQEYFNNLEHGEVDTIVSHKNEVMTKSGERKLINWHNAVLRDKNGVPSGLLSSGEDITQKMLADEYLRESETRYRTLFESMPIGVFYFNPDGTIQFANAAAEDILGIPLDEIVTRVHTDARWLNIHEDGSEFVADCLPSSVAMRTGKPVRNATIGIWNSRENAYRWVRGSAIPQFHAGEAVPFQVYVTMEDITERKKAEAVSKENQERLKFALEGSGLAEWDWNLKTNKIKRNDRWAGMLGYTPGELDGTLQQGVDLQHPDDRERLWDSVQDHLMGQTEYYDCSYRLRTKNGAYRWIHDCGKIVERDELGNPVRLCGTHADIDAQKQAEHLISTARNILSSILESSPEVIVFALDTQYRYLAFNARHKAVIQQIWGKEIAVGVSMLEIIGDHEDGKRAKENFDKALSGESFVIVEDYGNEDLSRQSWVDYWSPIRENSGEVIGLTCFVLNNTEQKRNENKIKALLIEKELILKEVHHRIKNNMNTVSSLLSLQASLIAEPIAITALEDAGSRIQSMSLLYDKLYRSADFTELSIRDYLPSLIEEVLAYFPNCTRVKVEKDIEDFILDARHMQPLGIIVYELITNTMKYAFKDRAAGLLTVVARNAGGHITISIADDGAGMPESVSFEHSTGFGLQLVQALTQQLDGTIRIDRDTGTKFVLEFDSN